MGEERKIEYRERVEKELCPSVVFCDAYFGNVAVGSLCLWGELETTNILLQLCFRGALAPAHKLVQQAPAMPVAMRIHEEFSVPHEIPKYDRQIREALKKFDWDASGGLRFQELAKVFKQPGTESGTGTPMTPEQIKV